MVAVSRSWRLSLGAALSVILGSALTRPAIARAWDHPVVGVEIQIESVLLRKHLKAAEAEAFRKLVEDSIIREARASFPCVEWGAAKALARPNATLVAAVVDREFGRSSKVFLTYRAVFHGMQVQDLGRSFDLEILGAEEYPGELLNLRSRVRQRLPDRFSTDRFRRDFNRAFIGKISIARSLQIDSGDQRFMIPVEAKRLWLGPESPIVVRLEAPLCTRKPDLCEVFLSTTGQYRSGRWAGALRCRLHSVGCCPQISWQELASRLQKVRDLDVFLGSEHTHCDHFPSLCLDGVARHPGTP